MVPTITYYIQLYLTYLEPLIQAKCFPFGLNNIYLHAGEISDGKLDTGWNVGTPWQRVKPVDPRA